MAEPAVTEPAALGEHSAARFRRFAGDRRALKAADEVERLARDLKALDEHEEIWARLALLRRRVGLVRRLHALLDAEQADEPEEMKQWEAALEKERAAQIVAVNATLLRYGLESERDIPEMSDAESDVFVDEGTLSVALVMLKLALEAENLNLLTSDEIETTKKAFGIVSQRANRVDVALSNWLASTVKVGHLAADEPASSVVDLSASDDLMRVLCFLLKVGDSAQKTAVLKLLRQLKISSKTASMVVSTGMVPQLVRLLECEANYVQHGIVEAIQHFAQDSTLRSSLVASGVVAKLWHVFCTSGDNDKSRVEVALQRLSEDDHAAVVISAAETVPRLIRQVQNEDEEAAEIASSLLLEMVEDGDYKDLMMSSSTLGPVSDLLDSRNSQSDQRRAAKLLSKLSRSKAVRARIANEATISGLVSLIEQDDRDGRHSAAVTLWNLFEITDLRPQIITTGVLSTILEELGELVEAGALGTLCDMTSTLHLFVDLLKSGEDAFKTIVAGILCTLVENFSMKKTVAKADPIPSLISFIRDQQSADRSTAAKLIGLLASGWRNRDRTVSEGGIGVLVTLSCNGNQGESAEASAALSAFADGKEKRTILSFEDMGELLRLVRHEDPVKSASGLTVLIKLFPDNGNRDAMISAGIVPLLICVIQNHHASQRIKALQLLGYLAHDNELEKQLGEIGAIEPVVAVLRDGTSEEKAEAATTLQSMSVQLENKALIVAAGGIEALLELVRDGNDTQKEKALSTLTNLSCRSNENKKLVGSAGTALFVGMLSSDSKVHQLGAVKVLRCLSNLEENKVLIVAAGSIPPLIKMARDGEGRHRTEALIALKLLALNPDNEVLIASSGGLEIALALVYDGNNDEKAAAAGLLTSLSVNPEHKFWLAAVGAVDALVQLVRDGNNTQRQYALEALSNLADTSDNRQLIASLDGISAVASLFSSDNADCRQKALRLVTKMAAEPELKMLVTAAGAIGTIVAVVSTLDEADAIRHAALDALLAIVDDIDCRHTMVGEGVIPCLVGLTKADAPSDLKDKAAEIIQSFIQDESLRELVVASGCVETETEIVPAVQLPNSTDESE